jgi:hypothetical protein
VAGLSEAHTALRRVLGPLRIEVGAEVLAMWEDRERHGHDPLPAEALRRVAEVAARLAAEADNP